MEINKRLRAAKYGYIVLSLLICALGTVIAVNPEISFEIISVICGLLMIVLAVFKIIGYLSKDRYRLAFQFDLAFGIISFVLGLTLILKSDALIQSVSFIMGLFIFSDSLFKIQIAIDSKEFGLKKWWVILIFAFLTAVFGLIMMYMAFKTYTALLAQLGISLLAEGLLNLATVLTAVNILQKKTDTE